MRADLRRGVRQRWAFGGFCVLALLACLIGLVDPVSASVATSGVRQVGALVRIAATACLVLVVMLGPGLVWRKWRKPALDLGWVPLPGLGLLVLGGGLAWALAAWVPPRIVCSLFLIPIVLGLTALVPQVAEPVLDKDESSALLIIGCVMAIAVGRSFWSLGPVGELYHGLVSRTLEVGDRPDSRISYHVVQLIAHGTNPYSRVGATNFLPYNFSDRGPLTGLASAPIVLVTGGRPPIGLPNEAWVPFDAQGFMAYRLAMMLFAGTAFLALYSLTQALADRRTARFALMIAATTPFLVHEVWFTWPKLAAATFVVLASGQLVAKRPFVSGVLLGVGYLVHPLALLSLPVLALVALWPLVGARLSRPRIVSLAVLAIGTGVFVLGWRLVNQHHFAQGGFFNYVTQANRHVPVTASNWVSDRIESVANTLVPLRLYFFSSGDPSINVVGGTSPAVVHFYFQYWTTVPFGMAIVFFPMLLSSLGRALRRWIWPVTVTVVLPFLVFAVYWGTYSSGLLREGLQPWVLALVIVVALEQSERGFPWLRRPLTRGVLALRGVEVLLVAVLPTLATRHCLVSPGYAVTDAVALVGMLAGTIALIGAIWRLPAPSAVSPSRRSVLV